MFCGFVFDGCRCNVVVIVELFSCIRVVVMEMSLLLNVGNCRMLMLVVFSVGMMFFMMCARKCIVTGKQIGRASCRERV